MWATDDHELNDDDDNNNNNNDNNNNDSNNDKVINFVIRVDELNIFATKKTRKLTSWA